MAESENKPRREEIFSRTVRAGKRTYFFDVKSTRSNEYYLTITESKRRFNNEQGKFYYEKHKVFLYKEDFEKFTKGMLTAIKFIETGEVPPEETEKQEKKETKPEKTQPEDTKKEPTPPENPSSIEFEDLDDDSNKS